MQRRGFLSFIVLLLFVVGVLPVLSMLIQSVVVDGHLDLSAYRGLFASRHHWMLMRNSLVLASWVSVLSVLAGVPLGIVFERTDFPFRRFFTMLFVVPLLIPPYIMAVSWSTLLGSSEWAASFLFGLPGTVFVLFSIFLPIPMLFTILSLKTIDPRLEAAGRLVATPFGVLRGIVLPLLFPGILLSAVLVFLLAFGSFSVPSFLRYPVFPVESFMQFSAFYDFKAATAAAVPLALVAILLLLAESLFLRKKGNLLRPLAAGNDPSPCRFGGMQKGLIFAVSTFGVVVVLLPLLSLGIQAGGLDAYAEAFRRAGDSLVRSLVYAACGATMLVFMGFFVGYLIQSKMFRFGPVVDFLVLLLFVLPGSVIGIGLIGLWNTPQTNWIYGTPWIILFGYLAKYTALSSRIAIVQLDRIPPSMEEAAQAAGASWFRRMGVVVLPLAWRGLVASWVVGYVFALRDTDIAMLVYPPGHDTLPVRIFTLMANGSPELIAALCVVMVATTLVPLALAGLLLSKKKELK